MRILFVDIDTLRPDHMGCYGYSRNTTPHLDAVARDGVRFTQCYTSNAPCLPSRAALISGRFGILNGVVGHGGTAADRRLTGPARDFTDAQDEGNFTNIFRRSGLHTVSFSTFAERHSAYWFDAGFHEIHNVGRRGGESAEMVVPEALAWLRANRTRDNWYMHLHLWDPHTPYRTPSAYADPFSGLPEDTWITPEVFERHLRHTGPHGLWEISMYDDHENPAFPKHPGKVIAYDQLPRLLNGYDNGIAYADAQLGQVFALLREQGIYEETAIIITSDHGENMGELGLDAEHGTADHPTCHVPLIIKWPGGAKNVAADGLRYQLDLVPTMATLLRQKINPAWSGQDFSGDIWGEPTAAREALVLSQMAHVCQRSARFGPWLYMRTYHDGYHLFDSEMLFDLERDPYEQHDVKARHPDICAQGAKIILDWHDEQMCKSDSPVDPLWTVMKEGGPYHTRTDLARYIRRLRETGRADGADRLSREYHVDA